MQKKSLLVIIALLLLIVPAVSLAEAESVGSNDLIDRAKDYDGQTVVYEGEVVGDILYRGDYAWLAVSDGATTLGCYVTKAQAEQISVAGGYGKRGDTVRVEGVFHRACAEHGGDLDIHAASVTVIAAGMRLNMTPSRLTVVLAAALPLPAAGLLFLVWKKRRPAKAQEKKSLTKPSET